jgi:hypothetical protein
MKTKVAVVSGVLVFLFAMTFAPAVFANSIGLTVNGTANAAIVPGSTVAINNVFSGLAGETDTLTWVGVVTPNGNTFIFAPGTNIVFSGGASSGGVTCNVPYGGSGSLSVTGQSGTASVTGCSGSNPLWLQTTSTQTLGSLSTACTASPNSPPATSGSASNGDTSQKGTYEVLACYSSTTLSGSFTSADQTFTTPEFGLGLGIAVAVALIGFALLRKSVFKLPTPRITN